MITTDATVLMRNSDEEKASENHKKTAKIQEKSEQKTIEHLTYQEWFMIPLELSLGRKAHFCLHGTRLNILECGIYVFLDTCGCQTSQINTTRKLAYGLTHSFVFLYSMSDE